MYVCIYICMHEANIFVVSDLLGHDLSTSGETIILVEDEDSGSTLVLVYFPRPQALILFTPLPEIEEPGKTYHMHEGTLGASENCPD